MPSFLNYIYVDPIGRLDSGITTYSHSAMSLIKKMGISCLLISKDKDEDHYCFLNRIQAAIDNSPQNVKTIVEIPETMAISNEINFKHTILHIRLHLSKSLGNLFQLRQLEQSKISLEQKELNRATIISAPSKFTVEASKKIYMLNSNIFIYPNPVSFFLLEEKNKPAYSRVAQERYILFVGRLHCLKGLHFCFQFAKELPDLNFYVVCSNSNKINKKFIPKNVKFFDGNNWDKKSIYINAQAVIIPSLFETASMVGIEALYFGVPIITWKHLGITEYSNNLLIYAIEPWNTEEFKRKIVELYFEIKKSSYPNVVFIKQIEQFFVDGINAIYENKNCYLMPVVYDDCYVKSLINKSLQEIDKCGINMLQSNSRWKRKFKKLLKEPKMFFADSKLFGCFWPCGYKLKKQAQLKANIQKLQAISNTENSEIKRLIIHNYADSQYVTNHSHNFRLFADISSDSKQIQFHTPPEKPVGVICAFLFPKGRELDAIDILNTLSVFDDFRYVKLPAFQVGTFDIDTNALDIINKIDLKNKQNISLIDHLILLDPPSELVCALRCCGTRQRLIVIITENHKGDIPSPWYVDVLIDVNQNINLENDVWRRKIIISDISKIHFAIRRSIQEGVPKSIDMFLPLMGFYGDYSEQFTSTDVKYFQGIIKLPKNFEITESSMDKIASEVASNMINFAVIESIYLKYKNLCDDIFNSEKRRMLILYCLYDGVIFDVRT